jgi:two-component system chemotaxis response regulator CheB
MNRIRVLIVDDAVVVRRLVADALAGDPALEVVGMAAHGRIGLTKIPQVNPDVVLLDVDMPEMDGLETLKVLRKTYPRLPVIMFSTLTQRGASATLEALALGANDYATKPAYVGSVAAAQQRIRDEVIPKIKTLCGRTPLPSLASTTWVARPESSKGVGSQQHSLGTPFEDSGRATHAQILAIGVSTGGPNALAALLPSIPADFPVPVVIVQHMPPMFTCRLAERLDSMSQLRVSEGQAGAGLSPGRVYVAPGDYHMVVYRDGVVTRLGLHQGPPENSCRPAVDVLFRSVAEIYSRGVLAVVLTGMGRDGLRGCEAIRAAGGQVLVQDEATSVVWGMPGYVAQAGLAHQVLPLEEIGPAIVRRVTNRRAASSTG